MDEPERNQPPPQVPGGRRRISVHVDREELALVAAREHVTAVLRIHDVEMYLRAVAEFGEWEHEILRVIAEETIASGNEPAIRYRAIGALSRHLSAANLNVLSDLANFGEDFYVRGHALLALGETGMFAHLPTILGRLNSSEPFERAAAARAAGAVARLTSAEAVRAHAAVFGGRELVEQLDRVLADLAKASVPAEHGDTAGDRPA